MMSRGDLADRGENAAQSGTYIHATAVALGEVGILIRGPSGSGKSRLALELIAQASRRSLFARLVGDDRVAIAACGGRLVARGHPAIAGQIESRGEGILALRHEPSTVIRLVIDLAGEAAAPPRLPQVDAKTSLCAVDLQHLSLNGPAAQRAGIILDHLLRMGNG
jgi:serine kinase of HPr protein (carbohydrate metabolism regulator)